MELASTVICEVTFTDGGTVGLAEAVGWGVAVATGVGNGVGSEDGEGERVGVFEAKGVALGKGPLEPPPVEKDGSTNAMVVGPTFGVCEVGFGGWGEVMAIGFKFAVGEDWELEIGGNGVDGLGDAAFGDTVGLMKKPVDPSIRLGSDNLFC